MEETISGQVDQLWTKVECCSHTVSVLGRDKGYTVSALGREEGYTVKYTPLPEGVPKGPIPRELLKAKGVYLTVYPELIPNTYSISF